MVNRLEFLEHTLKSVSNFLLLLALGIGFYTRWLVTQNVIILVLAFLGIFVFSISLALIYYFSLSQIGKSLSKLYIGCMLGVIAFVKLPPFSEEVAQESLMNSLLVVSLIVRFTQEILSRCISNYEYQLVSSFDTLEILGVSIAALALGQDFLGVSTMLLALWVTLISINLKSWLGVVNLLLIFIMCRVVYFPHVISHSVNVVVLMCFAGRVSFEPLIDLYFCHLSPLECWKPILSQPGWIRRSLITLIIALQLVFYSLLAVLVPSHKEWFVVVPLFIAFSGVWLIFHIIFVVTCWLLSNKISQCNESLKTSIECNRSLNQVLASRGVRHFSLISQRLLAITLLSTIVLHLLTWTRKTSLSLGLFCTVLPIECATLSLLHELGSALGGTCIGYALVAPALTVR